MIRGFKPYKGVSSNSTVEVLTLPKECFKPYKGVSSNHEDSTNLQASIEFQTL